MPVEKAIASSSLVEVLDRILDKGIVIDAWIRISAVGIEVLAIEARVVVASVETYLRYAEAIGLTASDAEAYRARACRASLLCRRPVAPGPALPATVRGSNS